MHIVQNNTTFKSVQSVKVRKYDTMIKTVIHWRRAQNSLGDRWHNTSRLWCQKVPYKDSLTKTDDRFGVRHNDNIANWVTVANEHLQPPTQHNINSICIFHYHNITVLAVNYYTLKQFNNLRTELQFVTHYKITTKYFRVTNKRLIKGTVTTKNLVILYWSFDDDDGVYNQDNVWAPVSH